ncbi:MAG: reactive intermediate/imine deaminase [Acidimicrobiaceae bacterium]|nr:reactive intermediate/imine deaminase [Acidimicrobiaceae bacterium]
MTLQEIKAATSPVPSGAYSQAIVANGLLFVAGVGPYDPATRVVIGSTIEDQTIQTVENLRAILLAAHCDLGDVVNSTVYLAELQRDWAGFDATYGSLFSAPYPARATTGAVLKGILVEIAVVAALPT